MTVQPTLTRRRAPRRTPCNVAALLALGLLAGAAVPSFAVTSSSSTPLLNNVILRGLVSDYRAAATFATSATSTGQTLTITQLLPKIILDWNQFNLANGSTIQFVQPSTTAAVLNRIYDANPTVIAGSIKANGQVYLVNQNGILFNRGTQIDTNSFFASTLNIDDTVFNSSVTTGGLFTPAFTGGYDDKGATLAGATSGNITLGGGSAGAAPSITAHAGGAVVIIAPVIDNQSAVIASSDGQVILAAGNAAYLGFSAAADSTLRGMLVQVNADNGKDVNLSSLINNAGTISADRGNVTLAALAINQSGRVSAKSAMLTNGSIFLQAQSQDGQQGRVTLSSNSVTETPLDVADVTTVSEASTFSAPVVRISGKTIDVEGHITSPSGAVTLTASDTASPGSAGVYLGPASTIDASGVWSTADDASNLLTFKVTSNELKDSPDQKAGLLKGATVTVDLRQDSSLLDLSGYQQNQQRTLQQKAAAGGSVVLNSTGSVVQHSDSVINVSGGGVHYTGATESTTKLLGLDGKLYDVMTAPEALTYTTIASSFTDTQARWGFSPTYTNLLMGASLKRPDFTQGASGGSLAINMGANATGVVLDGVLLAGATSGSQQSASAAHGGTLVIGTFDPTRSSQTTGLGDVTFVSGPVDSLPAGFTADSSLSEDRQTHLTLSTDVFASGSIDAAGNYVTTGFSSVTVNANGRVTVPENVMMTGPTGGSLTLRGNEVEIDGRIAAASGNVTATAIKAAGTADSLPAARAVRVTQGASIDTSGTWVNDWLPGAAAALPTAMANPQSTVTSPQAPLPTSAGGTITLTGPSVLLDSQSRLDVSAGGSVSTGGALIGGNAGSISLTADPTIASTNTASTGTLTMNGTLAGYGFGSGGALSLSAGGAVQIAAAGTTPTTSGLNLDSAFFSQGGFQSVKVAGLGDLTVQSGTVLQPQQQSLQFNAPLARTLASGGNIANASQIVTLPDYQRKPASLSLSAGGQLAVQARSEIETDVGATLSLAGVSGLNVNGTIYAPGGTINLSVTGTGGDGPLPKLELGANAIVSAHGTFVATPSDKGLIQGNLSGGGTVAITAVRADVALDAGSVVDVGGASQVVDMPSGLGTTTPYRQVAQSSNAGVVSIVADSNVTLAGALRGNADGTAAGGAFGLTLNERSDIVDTQGGRRIVVSQSGAVAPTDPNFRDVDVSIDKLAGAGFDKLRLSSEDEVAFSGNTSLAFRRGVTLDSHLIQVADGSDVSVSAASVVLADSFGTRATTNPGTGDPHSVIVGGSASPAQVSTTGTGTFRANAQTLDVVGNVTIGGVSSTTLSASGDLRLSGRSTGVASNATGAKISGALVTDGDITLSAAQIYPTTASKFVVAVANGVLADGSAGTPTPSGIISVTRSSGAQDAVFSAGGSLTLQADIIAQDGVVKAPLGTLNLQAGKTLTLGPTSVTSVSAGGLTIPYGETVNGVTWTYDALNANLATDALTAPPAKSISLAAPAVDVLTGAKVDVSGGGDVAAIEWIPGSGGSKNALVQPNTYAIIPAANLGATPIDPDIALLQNLGQAKDSAIYNSIHLGAGSGVPAGDYVLLPGYYALLKGAYSVQLLTGSTYANLQPGQTATLQNGQKVVPGVMTAAGTTVASSSTIGVLVRPGSDVAKLADYSVTTSSFFATLADASRAATPLLPTDGGQLSIAAAQRLTLNGTLVADLPSASSRSAEVDIAASKIALVDQVGRGDVAPDYLQIDSGALSALNASLLIGGTRSMTSTGEVVTPTASDIVVANSSANELKAPELVLAATDSITVRSGSLVEGDGSKVGRAVDFTVGGAGASSGAVLRVSNTGLVDIGRKSTDNSQGTVTVEAGATIAASGSLTLNATRTTNSSGDLKVAAGGALSLVSGTVSLGQTGGVAGLDQGLVLDNAQLANFGALDTLSIKSYGGIDLFGTATIGSASLAHLVIDGGTLTGHAAADGTAANAQVAAKDVALLNTSGGAATPGLGAPGAGAFTLSAGQVTLGAGDKSVTGFSSVAINASGLIVASGTGSLQAAAPLQLQAARIDSVGGANQQWTAQEGSGAGAVLDAVTIGTSAATSTPLPASTALGSRVQVSGSTIADAGNIAMKSGSVTLQSQDGVTLASGAMVDVSGSVKDFQGESAVADAGRITLAASNGVVQAAAGSTLNLSADDKGGNAGTLSLSGNSVDLSGAITAVAKAGTQGSVSVDVVSLADFSGLNNTLNKAGLTEARDLRVRSGDVTVAAGDVVTAHQLTLESDSGRVTVAGRIDASAPQGAGSVTLVGHDVTLAAGSTVDASGTSTDSAATAAPANGGSVTVIAEGGTLDFAARAVVDVRAGVKGSAGSVLLRAPRTASESVGATLQGQVLGQREGNANTVAAQVVVEGNKVYGTDVTGSVIDGDKIAGYAADNIAFMSAVDAAALVAGLKNDDGGKLEGVHVRPAVEVLAAGDLQVTSNWNLTGAGWQLSMPDNKKSTEGGSLVVRAAGNLTLASSSIGNPDTALQAAPTWNIGLTSGADLGATKSTRVQSVGALTAQAATGSAGAGDLVLDSANSEASIRTGTGSIQLAAGRDFVIKAGTDGLGAPLVGVVTTSGVAAIADPLSSGGDRFMSGGGDVAITAQRDAIGAGNEWLTEWYRAPTVQGTDPVLQDGMWWVYRPNFHDGVAALGGGNVAITAGNDVRDLSAWTPTSSMASSPVAGASLVTFGGGNLDVHANNDIVGGQYLLSLGKGAISAGGDIGGAGTPSQVFLMGAGGDPSRQGAQMALKAGGSIVLNTIDNPSSLVQLPSVGNGPSFDFNTVLPFLSYADSSSVALSAYGGDIRVGILPAAGAQLSSLDPDPVSLQQGVGLAVLPPKVDFTSFAGSIVYAGAPATKQVLYPSASGGLTLLAGKDVTNMAVVVSDANPAQFSVDNVASVGLQGTAVPYGAILTAPDTANDTTRIVSNTSSNAFINNVVALGGSVSNVTFTFPSRSRIWAADDIVNPQLTLQNLNADDVSALVANTGSFRITQPFSWGISGPGSLLVQAGQDVDLGTDPFTSHGNKLNGSLLSTVGANIDIVAGYSGPLDLSKLDATFDAVQKAGTAKKTADATAAINAFFTGKVDTGNIDSFNTAVESDSGGSINLLAPGGNITVGLPTQNINRLIGVVTAAGGAIRSYLSGDFDINQGKVLTAQGGDILIYTSQGSIDAGRGAKTSITTPPPTRTPITDSQGNVIGFTYSLPVAVSGSGIQTVTSKPNGPDSVAPKSGDIFLFAPAGVIDAGESGIKSGGAIFIAALTVLNADNISSVGTSTGVPLTPPGTLASSVAATTGSATADTKNSDAVAQAAAAAAAAGVTNFRPAILTVEVMGFGDKNCKETDKDCFAK